MRYCIDIDNTDPIVQDFYKTMGRPITNEEYKIVKLVRHKIQKEFRKLGSFLNKKDLLKINGKIHLKNIFSLYKLCKELNSINIIF